MAQYTSRSSMLVDMQVRGPFADTTPEFPASRLFGWTSPPYLYSLEAHGPVSMYSDSGLGDCHPICKLVAPGQYRHRTPEISSFFIRRRRCLVPFIRPISRPSDYLRWPGIICSEIFPNALSSISESSRHALFRPCGTIVQTFAQSSHMHRQPAYILPVVTGPSHGIYQGY